MKKRIIFIFFSLAFLASISSCTYDNPQFQGVSNLKVDHINTEELAFSLDAKIYNPNSYKVAIRPCTLDLYLGDLYVGKASLLQKYKMEKHATTTAKMPISIQLSKGVYLKLLGLSLGKHIELKLKGPLKVGVAGFGFRKQIEEKKRLNLSTLGINLKQLLGK